VKADDLSKLDAAFFFAVNGYISLLFLLFWGAANGGLARLKVFGYFESGNRTGIRVILEV